MPRAGLAAWESRTRRRLCESSRSRTQRGEAGALVASPWIVAPTISHWIPAIIGVDASDPSLNNQLVRTASAPQHQSCMNHFGNSGGTSPRSGRLYVESFTVFWSNLYLRRATSCRCCRYHIAGEGLDDQLIVHAELIGCKIRHSIFKWTANWASVAAGRKVIWIGHRVLTAIWRRKVCNLVCSAPWWPRSVVAIPV